MNQTITAKEAIDATIALLGQIEVPMSLFDKIGLPIKHAIGNLQVISEAEAAALEKKAREEAEAAEPVVPSIPEESHSELTEEG